MTDQEWSARPTWLESIVGIFGVADGTRRRIDVGALRVQHLGHLGADRGLFWRSDAVGVS